MAFQGKIWTDDAIEDALRNVLEIYKCERFPTCAELDELTGSTALRGAITKHGGVDYWANRLGYKAGKSETRLGQYFERIAVADIKTYTGLESEKMTTRHPYDILVDGAVKVDVKVSNLSKTFINVPSWNFAINKKNATCDVFIFYCLENEFVKKRIVVPAILVNGHSQVGMGLLSKYEPFEDRWDFINRYSDFHKSMLTMVKFTPKRRTIVKN